MCVASDVASSSSGHASPELRRESVMAEGKAAPSSLELAGGDGGGEGAGLADLCDGREGGGGGDGGGEADGAASGVGGGGVGRVPVDCVSPAAGALMRL